MEGIMSARRNQSVLIEALESRRLLTTYYVSPSGSDSSSGTSSSAPWKTFNNINARTFKAGDQILLQSGATFRQRMTFDSGDKGSSSAPIKVGIYGGTSKAAIDGGTDSAIKVTSTAGFSFSNLYLYSDDPVGNVSGGLGFYNNLTTNTKLNYIRVDNCEMGWFKTGIEIGGNSGSSGFNDVKITNTKVHDNRVAGIFSYGKSSYAHTNITVNHVQAYNNTGEPHTSTTGVTGHGIVLSSVNGATIEYCVAHDNGSKGDGGAGIWCYDATKVLMRYCESYKNKTAFTHDGDGFDLDRNTSSSTIEYCYSHDNDGGGFMLCNRDNNSLHTGNVIRYNISQNDGRKNGYGGLHAWGRVRNAEVYNNTVYMNQAPSGSHACIRVPNQSIESNDSEKLHFRNNILISLGATALVSVTSQQLDHSSDLKFQGNAYYAASGGFKIVWGSSTLTSITSFRGKAQEMNGSSNVGFSGDPKVTSMGGGGTFNNADKLTTLTAYKLQSTSPVKNIALDLKATFGLSSVGSRDFWGTALPQGGKYDIGADEA
jgi:hypothetical protein